MKFPKQNRENGGVLLLTLITCVLIGIVLGSFLALISARNKMAMRSTCWNAAIPVLEAGIEEALTHMTKDKKPALNGWTATTVGGQPVHVKTRTLPDGSYYNVTIYNATSESPMIYSQGFVPSPLEKNKYISRLVRVGVTNPPSLFIMGIVARNKIRLTGNSVVDGYDSASGSYNVTSNRLANGGIATTSNEPGAVEIGGGHVYGTVKTGPDGTVVVGGGAVGDVAWNTTHQGIQPGWTNDNMNAAFPTNSPPAGGPFLAPTFTAGMLFLGNGTNQLSSFTATSANKSMVVQGEATLYITGDLTIGGTGVIRIMPGASLKLYVGGSVKISGGGVVNHTGLAANVSLIGLSTCTDVTIGGNGEFYGTVNAPSADIKVNGGGAFYGAAIGNSFTSVGGGSFHYDRALAQEFGWYVNSWKEL